MAYSVWYKAQSLKNGFMITFNEAVYIINPLLGEVMMLPQVNQSDDIDFVLYGFGFSKPSDHYKVLRIVGTPGRRIHGEIFTIGVDHKWRSFEDSSIPCLIFKFGVNLNGVVYFVGGVVRDSGLIIAFDMEEERGHRIPLPSESLEISGATLYWWYLTIVFV